MWLFMLYTIMLPFTFLFTHTFALHETPELLVLPEKSNKIYVSSSFAQNVWHSVAGDSWKWTLAELKLLLVLKVSFSNSRGSTRYGLTIITLYKYYKFTTKIHKFEYMNLCIHISNVSCYPFKIKKKWMKLLELWYAPRDIKPILSILDYNCIWIESTCWRNMKLPKC